jgi:hypothetical protein
MRKVSSVILKAIAGFFFYMVSLLAFVSEPPVSAKLVILIAFTVPAIAALGGGLALARFRNWRRDTGIVLLCASGFTVFVIFTFTCLLVSEEFQKMMRQETLVLFKDYLTGGGVIVGLSVVGWILTMVNKRGSETDIALEGDSAALHPRK